MLLLYCIIFLLFQLPIQHQTTTYLDGFRWHHWKNETVKELYILNIIYRNYSSVYNTITWLIYRRKKIHSLFTFTTTTSCERDFKQIFNVKNYFLLLNITLLYYLLYYTVNITNSYLSYVVALLFERKHIPASCLTKIYWSRWYKYIAKNIFIMTYVQK